MENSLLRLLAYFLIILSTEKNNLAYVANRHSITFPLKYVDYSINTHDSSSITEKILLPTGKCEDMRDRDLSLFLPNGVVPRRLYPGFIDSNRVSCLSITDSFIENVAVGSFDYLPNLLYLDMSRNRIEFCDLLTFGGHDKLRTLVIDENNSQNQQHPLNDLILSRIDCFPQLKNFYFRNNQLRGITASLRYAFPSLTHLYLSDNRLEGRTFDYLELPFTLTHLHIERNWISRLSCSSHHELINLSSLFLDGNRIQSICYWHCHGSDYLNLGDCHTNQLEFLSISRNKITNIERGSFDCSRYLKSLNLAHNQIDTILPGTFDILQELRDLSLSYNRLMSLPDLRSVRMLTSLSLDHNNIDTIPSGIFCDLHHLKWLSLGGNQISIIHVNAFVNLPSLEELDLSNNRLSYLNYGWIDGNTCNLRHLDLRENHFKNIESLNIDNIPSLLHLYIQGNPMIYYDLPVYRSGQSRNASVHVNYDSSLVILNREPNCYVRCNRMHREYVIPRLTFSDEWTW